MYRRGSLKRGLVRAGSRVTLARHENTAGPSLQPDNSRGGGSGSTCKIRCWILTCSLFLNRSGDARGARYKQGLHLFTTRHLRVRWLKALA
jgi:hypothetical protein